MNGIAITTNDRPATNEVDGDRLNGNRAATSDTGINFGSISLRGESSALLLSDALFVRCRYNPFYELMENRMVNWLNRAVNPATAPSCDSQRVESFDR